jgi:general secretion pathway protein K
MLIKGISPELFYGSQEKPGISQFMTVHGVAGSTDSFSFPGRININTAELPVLMALMPSENQDLVEGLLEFRQEVLNNEEGHDFSNPGWYKEIPGLSDVNINKKLITNQSDIFRIETEAKLHEVKSKTNAVVQRVRSSESGKWSCKILSWKTE